MSEYILMPPVGDGYSSISDDDFDDLITSQINIQIAAQWLYNVKGFSNRRVVSNSDTSNLDPHPPAEDETIDYIATNLFSVAINDLKSNPQLRFYEPNQPNQYLKASVNNSLYYYTTNSPDQELEPYFFVKKGPNWYAGISNYAGGEGAVVTITASLIPPELYTKFEYPTTEAGYDVGTIVENTFTITDTFYP